MDFPRCYTSKSCNTSRCYKKSYYEYSS